jgi:DNA-binding transcriptional LysR family regulator
MIELRHLRYFVAVAEELHFGRAAEKLYIAQPPLSQQIKQLEQSMGVELFIRNRRRVRLTEAGHVFLEQARRTLAQADYAVQAAQRAATGESGRLEVGFVSSATYHDVIPNIIRAFRDKHPDAVLALHELTSAEQVQALRDRQIDVGFVRPPIGDDTVTLESVLYEPFVAALPSSHALSNAPEISLSALSADPFVMLPRHLNLSLYDQIVTLCQQSGFSPRVAQEAVQLQTISSLVAAGIGVSLVPASVQNLRRSGVVYKRLRGVSARIEIAAAYREDDAPATLGLFLSVIRDIARLESPSD